MLYDAHNQPIESTLDDAQQAEQDFQNIPLDNFPPPTPKPAWFDDKITEIGGYADPGTNKIPKYRVVWGMDPAITQFAMGETHMKYVSIIDTYETLKGYNVIQTKGKKVKRFFLNPRDAHAKYFDTNTGLMTRNVQRGEIIQPVITTEKKEIGQPFWVVEQYVPPEGFGDPIEWENERYLINPANPLEYIDALGEYPAQGRYIHWFDLLDADDDGKPTYKELDEHAVEIVRANHVSNIARRKRLDTTSVEQARKQRDAKFDEDWAKLDHELTTEMRDIKKHKAFNITSK